MRFYPGGRWVDWVALDGFNWGAPIAWQSFSDIFDRSYRKLVSTTSKPIMIAEIGSDEAGGSKAHWLRRALGHQLPRLKRIRAVVWFDATDGADFRVDSSPPALAAFRRGIGPALSGETVGRLGRLTVPHGRRGSVIRSGWGDRVGGAGDPRSAAARSRSAPTSRTSGGPLPDRRLREAGGRCRRSSSPTSAGT